MTREIEQDCTYCRGAGEYEARHPEWGSPTCPEAYVMKPCGECEGTGKVLVEVPSNHFLLNSAEWNRVMKELENPEPPSEGLVDLMGSPVPWKR